VRRARQPQLRPLHQARTRRQTVLACPSHVHPATTQHSLMHCHARCYERRLCAPTAGSPRVVGGSSAAMRAITTSPAQASHYPYGRSVGTAQCQAGPKRACSAPGSYMCRPCRLRGARRKRSATNGGGATLPHPVAELPPSRGHPWSRSSRRCVCSLWSLLRSSIRGHATAAPHGFP
jgi:hypothetical protein